MFRPSALRPCRAPAHVHHSSSSWLHGDSLARMLKSICKALPRVQPTINCIAMTPYVADIGQCGRW